MQFPFLNQLKYLWQTWDLRAFVLLSLSLQSFLILVAPLRKRTYRGLVFMPLWSAYLLADWAANFAVGLISNSQSDKCTRLKTSNNSADLLAYWAPFLLVHLGGPDTITAFSLEDNELWLRHLLGLIFQLCATIYVFYQSLPKNKLWIPTVLMFVCGLIKYSERTIALYRASLDSFREYMLRDPDPGPNYAKLMDEYHSKKEANLPTDIAMVPEPDRGEKAVNKVKEGTLSDTEVVLYAYNFFNTFKGLIVDLIFGYRERNQSREFFLKRTAEDALKVISAELNFIYDVLFTKVSVVYTKWGYVGRFVSFAAVVTSLGLFYSDDKNNFLPTDIAITYTLLIGAIALDVIAFIKLITSDWLRVSINELPDVPDVDNKGTSKLQEVFKKLVEKLCPQLLRRRWSEKVATYNLIFYCLHRRSPKKEKVMEFFRLTSVFDGLMYVEHEGFSSELWKLIFQELKMKSEISDDLETGRKASEAKGDSALRGNGCDELLQYVLEVDYDQSLLLWHIATELCYRDEIGDDEEKDSKPGDNNYRSFSNLLSNYMLYLLIMQPTMMSAVAGIGQIRFRDTCAEAQKFFFGGSGYQRLHKPGKFRVIIYGLQSFLKVFIDVLLSPVLALIASLFHLIFQPLVHLIFPPENIKKLTQRARTNKCCSRVMKYCSSVKKYLFRDKKAEERLQKEKCKNILDVYTEVKPVTIKGDKSKSVLFDACILAKKLKELQATGQIEDKWEIMSKVWIEMLSYAAVNCRARTHAQQLSKGGELMTLVWLLMAHLGLGKEFQINEGLERAKLIVGK